MYMNR